MARLAPVRVLVRWKNKIARFSPLIRDYIMATFHCQWFSLRRMILPEKTHESFPKPMDRIAIRTTLAGVFIVFQFRIFEPNSQSII